MARTYRIVAAAALSLAVCITANPVYAQTMNSGSQSGAYSQSAVQFGNSPRQAPNAIAPGLMASGLSCLGSASIGGSGSGFGISFGMTKEDRSCNAREDARYLHAFTNNTNIAIARMCQIPDNRRAIEDAGFRCPGNSGREVAPAVSNNSRVVPAPTSVAPSVPRQKFQRNAQGQYVFANLEECRAAEAQGLVGNCRIQRRARSTRR